MCAVLCVYGIQLTATHLCGLCSDLTQEEVQHLWRYNLYSEEWHSNEFQFLCMLVICSVTDTLSTPIITKSPLLVCQDLLFPHRSMHASWEQESQDLGYSLLKKKGCTKCCIQWDSNPAIPACQTRAIPLGQGSPLCINTGPSVLSPIRENKLMFQLPKEIVAE